MVYDARLHVEQPLNEQLRSSDRDGHAAHQLSEKSLKVDRGKIHVLGVGSYPPLTHFPYKTRGGLKIREPGIIGVWR